MANTERRARYIVVTVCVVLSLVFFLDLIDFSSFLSSSSCEGTLTRNESIVCLLKSISTGMFGEEDGIKVLAAALCIYMLYVAWYMSSAKFDTSRIEGSALGNRIAAILGVAVFVVLLWGLICFVGIA